MSSVFQTNHCVPRVEPVDENPADEDTLVPSSPREDRQPSDTPRLEGTTGQLWERRWGSVVSNQGGNDHNCQHNKFICFSRKLFELHELRDSN